MDIGKLRKTFPSYMNHITLPQCAIEQEICVYRACRTYKIEKESFLTTYEENGFHLTVSADANDPQEYSLSTFERVKDVKRFVSIDGRYNPPWVLAKGTTSPVCGISSRTREWKKTKSSHVDWWLYESAEPWKYFVEVDYENERKKAIQNK